MTLPNEILIEEAAALLAEGRDVELQAKGDSMLPFIVGDRDSVIRPEKLAFRVERVSGGTRGQLSGVLRLPFTEGQFIES